jgi:preprotein translocase subunit SecY
VGRRIAITLAMPAALLVLRFIPLPLADGAERLPGSMLGLFNLNLGFPTLHLGMLGVQPILTAMLLVELAALAWPAWRHLRVGGPADRARLGRATRILALLLAAMQAWGIVAFVGSLRGPSLFDPGPPPGLARVAMMAALIAPMYGLWGLVKWIDRRGVMGGFPALVVSGALSGALGSLVTPLLVGGGGRVLLGLVGVGIAGVAAAAAFRPRPAAEGERRLREPVCSAVPITAAASLLMLPATIAMWLPASVPGGAGPLSGSVPFPIGLAARLLAALISLIPGLTLEGVVEALQPGSEIYIAANVVAVAVLAFLFSWLFARPALLASVEPPERRERVRAGSPPWLRRAAGRSALLFAVVVVALGGAGIAGGMGIGALTIFILVAAGLDLRDELRFRAGKGELAAAWALHRVYEIEPALEVLGSAGIPSFPRNARLRTLGQFFDPWFPIELFVPAEKRDEAEKLLLARALSAP